MPLDSLCVLSGLTHCDEPHALYEYQTDVVDSILAELDPALRRRLPGLRSILIDATEETCDHFGGSPSSSHPPTPPSPPIDPRTYSISTTTPRRSYIIGVFAEGLGSRPWTPMILEEAGRSIRTLNLPLGYDIGIRIVDSSMWPWDGEWFKHIVDGVRVAEITLCHKMWETDSFGLSPNFLVREEPFHYLKAWIDWESLPARNTAELDPRPMDFAGELYEIVHSRFQRLSESSHSRLYTILNLTPLSGCPQSRTATCD